MKPTTIALTVTTLAAVVATGGLTYMISTTNDHPASPTPAAIQQTTTTTKKPPRTTTITANWVGKDGKTTTTHYPPPTTRQASPNTYQVRIFHSFDVQASILIPKTGEWGREQTISMGRPTPQDPALWYWAAGGEITNQTRYAGIKAYPYLDNYIRCEVWSRGKLMDTQSNSSGQPVTCKTTI